MNLWTTVLEELKQSVNPQSYQTWLKPTRFVEASNSHITVRVPNEEFKDWIEEHFAADIRQALDKSGHSSTAVQFAYPAEAPPKPAELPKPTPKPSLPECPVAPEAAWYGLAKDYRSLVNPTTSASDNYHLASFLCAAGAGLGKTVFTKMGGKDQVFPNLYVALVGRSSHAHKGTCMNLCRDLAVAANPSVAYTTDIASAQGLIGDLKENEKACTLIACLAELKELIAKSNAKGLGSLMPKLCELYDSPPRVGVKRVNHPIHVDNPPMFSIFAGCAPRWLENLEEEDLESGVGNRVMFVAGEPRDFIPEPPDLDVNRWNSLAARLADCFKYWRDRGATRFRFSEKAKERWNRFCIQANRPIEDAGLISVMNGRSFLHAGKTAMIYAALDRSDVIGPEHLKPAIAFTDFLFSSLVHIFKEFGASKWVKEDHKIIEVVNQRGRISWENLYHLFQRTISAERLEQHVRFLAGDDRPLSLLWGGLNGKKRYLIPNPEWGQDA